jgi:hypothetical protein
MVTEGIDHENLEAIWNIQMKNTSRPESTKTPGTERVRQISGTVSTTGAHSDTSSFIESVHGTEEGKLSRITKQKWSKLRN